MYFFITIFTQGIKAAIYDHYGVTADPSSHSTLDGEDKLCMKGKSCMRQHLMVMRVQFLSHTGSHKLTPIIKLHKKDNLTNKLIIIHSYLGTYIKCSYMQVKQTKIVRTYDS